MQIKSTIVTILLVISIPVSATAQRQNKNNGRIRWDLSYESILTKESVPRNEFIWTWLKTHPAFIKKEIARWRESIVSSILMEKPAFQGRQRETIWLFRTRKKAFFKAFVDGKLSTDTTVPLRFYDDLFTQVSSLQQGTSLDSARMPPGGISGYCGFLSLYGRRRSRQMLLTMEDFYSNDQLKRGNVETEFADGRLAKLLAPLFKIRG